MVYDTSQLEFCILYTKEADEHDDDDEHDDVECFRPYSGNLVQEDYDDDNYLDLESTHVKDLVKSWELNGTVVWVRLCKKTKKIMIKGIKKSREDSQSLKKQTKHNLLKDKNLTNTKNDDNVSSKKFEIPNTNKKSSIYCLVCKYCYGYYYDNNTMNETFKLGNNYLHPKGACVKYSTGHEKLRFDKIS
jgi:hypothetical protein